MFLKASCRVVVGFMPLFLVVPWVGLWSVVMAYFGHTKNSVLNGHPKGGPKIGFKYRISRNAGQKYCRMREHSAILSTFIKLPFSNKTFDLSIF